MVKQPLHLHQGFWLAKYQRGVFIMNVDNFIPDLYDVTMYVLLERQRTMTLQSFGH